MSNNRRRGNSWERECRKILSRLFPFIVTSRSESRSRDGDKVDLMNRDERKNGPLPYDFQCKNTKTRIKYDVLLDEMPQDQIPVILHKKTEKRGKRFFETGRYAILKMEDFISLLEKIHKDDS